MAGPDDSSVGADGYTPASLTGYTAGSFAEGPAASPGVPKARETTFTEPAEPTAYVPLVAAGKGSTALYAPVDGETPQSAALPIQAAMGTTAGRSAAGRGYSTVAYAADAQPGHQAAVPNVGEATDGPGPVLSTEPAVTAPTPAAIGDTAGAAGSQGDDAGMDTAAGAVVGQDSTVAHAGNLSNEPSPGHQAPPKEARIRVAMI